MNQQCVKKFRTPGCHGFAVHFSPFVPSKFACATSNNFGIKGKGSLFICDVDEHGEPPVLTQSLPTETPLFDVSWSDTTPWVAYTASSDGVVHVWNVQDGSCNGLVSGSLRDISSVDCSHSLVCAASWDGSIKIWDPSCDSAPVVSFVCYAELAYEARWSPFNPDTCLTVGGDGTLRMLDMKSGNMSGDMVIPAHPLDALSCDWSKFDDCLVASAGADTTVKGWDLRRPDMPLFVLAGHKYGIKRLRFSPIHPTLMATASYDFTTRLWDYRVSGSELEVLHHHSEFVHGLDFSRSDAGVLLDCAWDETVCLYRPTTLQAL